MTAAGHASESGTILVDEQLVRPDPMSAHLLPANVVEQLRLPVVIVNVAKSAADAFAGIAA